MKWASVLSKEGLGYQNNPEELQGILPTIASAKCYSLKILFNMVYLESYEKRKRGNRNGIYVMWFEK